MPSVSISKPVVPRVPATFPPLNLYIYLLIVDKKTQVLQVKKSKISCKMVKNGVFFCNKYINSLFLCAFLLAQIRRKSYNTFRLIFRMRVVL